MNKILFFLGAGSSIPSGIYGVIELLEEFKKELQGKEEGLILEKLLNILQEWKTSNRIQREIDLELLLELTDKISILKTESLYYVFNHDNMKISMTEFEKFRLNDRIKQFVRKICIEKLETVEYLKPILTFAEEQQLHVFTTNYDLCMEKLCTENKLDYSDGFNGDKWNPLDCFSNKETRVFIYKLHGSINWARTEKGRYIKLNTIGEAVTSDMLTKETFVPLIVYPGKKLTYHEPMFDLLQILNQTLRSVQYCIVVGYSYKDDHLSRLFKYASEHNQKLILLVIDPRVYDIFYNEISIHKDEEFTHGFGYHNYDSSNFDTEVPTILDRNAICLPYRIQYIIQSLKSVYLNNLEAVKDIKKDGVDSKELVKAILCYIDAEYIYKVDEYLESYLKTKTFEIIDILQILLKLRVLCLIHKSNHMTHNLIKRYSVINTLLNIDNFQFNPITADLADWRKINLQIVANSQHVPLVELMDALNISSYIELKKIHLVGSDTLESIRKFGESLSNLIKYLKHWKNGITFQNYIDKMEMEDRVGLVTKMNAFNQHLNEEYQRPLQAEIHRIEKPHLNPLLDEICKI